MPINSCKCSDCGYLAEGIVTVRGDRIIDVYVWPSDLLQMRKDSASLLFHYSPLTTFLIVREFGADVLRAALEQRTAAFARYPEAVVPHGNIPPDEPGTHGDYVAINRFYECLEDNFKKLRGEDYSAKGPNQ